MRLRPSGQKGPVATQLSSFIDYQAKEAWTWEHLALTRARVISGPPELRGRVEAAIRQALLKPRDAGKLTADVREMRERIAKEKGTDDIWDLKQVRGGLVDLEFIAQYLQLRYAAAHPEVLDQNTVEAFRKLRDAGVLSAEHADVLIPATRLLHDLTQILRLCLEGPLRSRHGAVRAQRAACKRGRCAELCRAGRAAAIDAPQGGRAFQRDNRVRGDKARRRI